ncbi:sensor histidine kinase [Catalinimonas niigatensis]|uniref:sensor histidine kinase n=1 Tax=Catalinimonas niigatensis TaxID=1397264 RepID=UPI002665352E|nr:ATP-binding protein [Catalinimonas niigatensis]WPP49029.1 ATP-binding protein [Catalinimonas niigatensis]
MLVNARGVAFLLGISISIVTTAFLSLVEGVSTVALLVTLILSFSSSYILINISLEFMIFREINKIYNVLDKLKRKDLSFVGERERKRAFNPLKQINEEIFEYAANKQKEINDLKKMEEFRREFVANVSHELKTPIFAAQGFVHTLLDGAIDNKKVRYKFLKKAGKSLDGLDMLVQDLLTLSQMETGDIKMYYVHFDISHMVREVFEQFEGDAESKDIELILKNKPRQHPYVFADEQRIYQVLVNLISNAIKYTKKEGAVEVFFKNEKDGVEIFVKDYGRGIPPEDIDRIFERFYRVEKSRSKNKGGTGLGLAIVKHIIELHHSKIKVLSEVNKGSVFSFKLPKGNKEEVVVEDSFEAIEEE